MIHWVKIPFSYDKGVEEILEYLEINKDRKAKFYYSNSSFDKYARIKTEQSYQELNLGIDMCYGDCLRYVKNKPNNITEFHIKEL